MKTWTVHLPAGTSDTGEATLIPERFSVAAAVFGPLWTLWHGMWLATLGLVVVQVGFTTIIEALRLGLIETAVAGAGLAVLIGLTAQDMRRWTLSKRGWRLVDVVVSSTVEGAERRFYERATLALVPDPAPPSRPHPREKGAPPPWLRGENA